MTESEVLAALGSRIRTLRTTKGLSLSELAYRCEFEKASLSRIELGKTNTTILTLTRISKALEIHIGELFPEH
ncbi:MAG TPA: helix-turn-helix transcriptional regulator [Chitinophagaceae bacterium]